jgi:hypothetical protein
MQNLAHWLEKLGMSEYARRFAGNGISAAALQPIKTSRTSAHVVFAMAWLSFADSSPEPSTQLH